MRETRQRVARFFLLLGLLIPALWCGGLPVWGAPVLAKKKEPLKLTEALLAGEWDVEWGASRWKATLGKDGAWDATSLGELRYLGSWGYANTFLMVHERTVGTQDWAMYQFTIASFEAHKGKVVELKGHIHRLEAGKEPQAMSGFEMRRLPPPKPKK